MLLNTPKRSVGKLKNALCAVFTVIALVCSAVAFALLPAHGRTASADISESDVAGVIDNMAAYTGTEEVISTDGFSANAGIAALTVGRAKIVRFTGSKKLVFSKSFTVKPEAHVILDAETEFEAGCTVTVNGTLTVNGRLFNKGTVTVSNSLSPYDEYPSEGVLVNGSFNNDGGSISVKDKAAFKIAANTVYDANGANDAKGITANGGALMIKEGTVSGAIQNEGSIIYNGTAPSNVTGSGAVVGATFRAASNGLPTAAGTYVIYDDSQTGNGATVSSSVTFSNAVNLLSFGKVTFKLGANNTNYTVSCNVSLGGVSLGGGKSDGKYYTQGANELIFDGGAAWTPGESEFNYAEEKKESSTAKIIFYDEINRPYVYVGEGITNSGSAFFDVSTGTLSTYGGTKITNYAMTGGSKIGGGVRVASGHNFFMYGGEISWCGVTGSSNGGTGGGIYCGGGAVHLFGGKVTHNAVGNSSTTWSADGAGISIDTSTGGEGDDRGYLYMYGGEVSYNHGALERAENGADGGGVMLNASTMYMYGGEIRGNYTGGAGGGVGLWVSELTMKGGTIAENHAVFGGGIGAVGWTVHTDKRYQTSVTIQNGLIQNNNAFQAYKKLNTAGAYGGYGGGICVGSEAFPLNAMLTFEGNTVVSGNKAYYGGGLAVYTQNNNGNQLEMKGGLISGNAAYAIPSADKYCDTYMTATAEAGGGVYVDANEVLTNKPMLLLSNDASIDSSNSVSFNVNKFTSSTSNYAVPISVTGDLTGSGLGALVCLSNPAVWSGKNVVSFTSSANATKYLDKFVLDNDKYAFGQELLNNKLTEFIQVGTTSESSYVAQIVDGQGNLIQAYSTLAKAITAANGMTGNVTIEILKSTTVENSYTVENNITIRPASDKDVTLVIASGADIGSGALFTVSGGGSLTLNGTNGTGSRLTVDGNGTGRLLKKGSTPQTPFVQVNTNATLTMQGNVYLRNNLTNNVNASAIVVNTGGMFNMEGGVIEDNVTEYATGSAVYFSDNSAFYWTGGTIQDNTNSAEAALANYGVYLSASTVAMNLDQTVTLTNNVIYSDAAQIRVQTSFNAAKSSNMTIVLPVSSTNLVAGKQLVYISSRASEEAYEAVSEKFTIESSIDGLSTGTVDTTDANYPKNIVIYRTTTYIFNAAKEGKTVEIGNLGTLIGDLTSQHGAAEVKARMGGETLVVKVRSNRNVAADGLLAISDFYTCDGYTIMKWGDLSYQGALPYKADNNTSANPVTYAANWTPNVYEIAVDYNAPKNNDNQTATVGGNASGSSSAPDYEQINSQDGVLVPAKEFYVTGFVFSGWKSGDASVFTGAKISEVDVKAATATATRGRYQITAKAQWTPLFGSEEGNTAIGNEATPFIISDEAHLMHLAKTVAGEAVKVEVEEKIGEEVVKKEYTYYNGVTDGALSPVAASYSGFYFKLAGDLSVSGGSVSVGAQNAPFGGTFDGANHTVTLSGSALFGYLENATVKNVYLAGSVSSGEANVGALANVISGGTVNNAGNTAAVTATAESAAVGGVAGKATGVTFKDVFNSGAITGAASGSKAGGIVGASSASGITATFNSGAVTGKASAGGLVALSEGTSDVELRQSYNTGKIVSEGAAGGIVGYATNGINVYNSFNGGAVTGAAGSAGAIVGTGSSVAFSNVYYNTDKTDALKAIGNNALDATALTSSKMYVDQASENNDKKPQGMSALSGEWAFIHGGTEFCYYPQLKAFANSANTAVQTISANSVKLTIPDPDKEDDKPLPPEQKITITYILNGGEYSGNQTVFTKDGDKLTAKTVFGAGETVPQPQDTVLSKTGYKFDAWYMDEACKRKYDFASGVSASDLTLYANWTAREYGLFYGLGAGGGSQEAFVKTVSLTSGKVMLPTEDITTRIGYTFLHWLFTDKTTQGKPVDSLEIKANTQENDALYVYVYNKEEQVFAFPLLDVENNNIPLNFEAAWTPVSYKITYGYFDTNADPITSVVNQPASNPNTYTIETQMGITFVSPTCAGYEFQGWIIRKEALQEGKKLFDEWKETLISDRLSALYPPEDCFVYGVFKPITYQVSFDPVDGKLAKKDGDRYVELSEAELTRLGFKKDKSSTLYYVEIIYNTTYTYGEDQENLNNIGVIRTGYDFGGWFISRNPAEGEKGYDFSEAYTYPQNTVFKAKLTIQTFTVTVTVDNTKGYFTKELFKEEDYQKIYVPATGPDGKFYQYNITVEYGKSGYALLKMPTSVDSSNKFSGWKNLENIIDVKENATGVLAVSAQFETNFTVVFLNSYTTDEAYKLISIGGLTGNITLEEIKENANYREPPAITGYVFAGWYYVSNEAEAKDTDTFNAASVLYAKYTPATVTVDPDTKDPVSGDTITPQVVGNLTYTYDQTFTLDNLPTATYEKGFIFDGWYLDAACTTSAVGTKLSSATLVGNEYKITLYAKWKAISYTISYSLNASDAKWENKPQETYTYADTFKGIEIPTDANVATRPGYTLKGWSGTAEDNKIAKGSAANLVLVAIWEPNTYTVTFSAGDGVFTVPDGSHEGEYLNESGTVVTTGTAKVYRVSVTHGSAAVAPVIPEKEGHSFDGWDAQFTNIAGDTAITATYRKNSYGLHLINQGSSAGDPLVNYDELLPTTITVPTREGYTFKGWYFNVDGSANDDCWISYEGGSLSTDKKMPANEVTLYAHWQINKYTVTFKYDNIADTANAGKIQNFINGIFKKTETPTGNVYTDIEYGTDLSKLNGSNVITDNVIVYYLNGDSTDPYSFTVATDNITVYVGLETSVAKVTFDYNESESGSTKVEMSYVFGAKIVFYTPVRKGYEFLGWYSDKACTENEKVDTNQDVFAPSRPSEGQQAEGRTYYANWRIITYTINYVFNDGRPNVTKTYDVTTETFSHNSAQREGYDFDGWFDGIVNGDQCVTVEKGSTGHMMLFAHWTAKTYKITVEGYTENDATATNGETGSDKTVTVTFGSDADALKALRNRPYHNVTLHFGSESGTEFASLIGNTVPALDEMEEYTSFFQGGNSIYTATVYAVYTKQPYKVVYHGVKNDDTTTDHTTEETYSYGDTYAISTTIEAQPSAGNTHVGWKVKLGNVEVVITGFKFNYNGTVTLTSENGIYQYPVGTIDLYPAYETTQYTVKFDLQGGSGSMAEQGFSYNSYAVLAKYEGSKTGYTFAGWATDAGSTAVAYANGAVITSTATDTTITLYAVWTPVIYTVLLKSDNAEFASYSANLQSVINLPTPTKNGYTFTGWYIGETSYGSPFTVTKEIIGTLNGGTTITLTAGWSLTSYTITYVLNGGTNAVNPANPATYTVESENITLSDASRNGYKFKGWYSDAAFTTECNTIAKGSTGNKTFYAKWDAIEYNIEYELNGGTNNSLNPTTYTVEDTVVLGAATRENYEFKGWYTDAECTTASNIIEKGSTGEKTFHAKWEPIEYHITYILNGGTNDSCNPTGYNVESEDISLREPTTRSGYTFKGWYEAAEISDYDAANKIEKIVKGSSQNYILYAHWEVVKYTVTVNAGDGKFADNETEQTFTVSSGGTMYEGLYPLQKQLVPNKAGESFLAWTTKNDKNEDITLTNFTVTDNITIYASYSATHVGITVVCVDGTSAVQIVEKNREFTNDEISEFVNHNHTGYQTDVAATWQLFGENGWESWIGNSFTESVTLREVLTGNSYTVTLNGNGGTFKDDDNQTPTVTYGSAYGEALLTPSRPGYTFEGWHLQSENGEYISAESIVKTDGNHTLVAKWVANYYTVEFDYDYGTNNKSSITVLYGDDASVTLPEHSRLGYTFEDWKVGTKGDTTIITATSVKLSEVVRHAQDGKITLTAEWKLTEYTLEFNLNGGMGTAADVEFNVTIDRDIPLPVTTRSGYAFNGWSWSAGKNSGTVGSDVEKLSVKTLIGYAGSNTQITFTAEWSMQTYTITYVLGGGTNNSLNPTTYTVESATITLNDASRAGYTFADWYSDAECTTASNTIEKGSTGNKTFYAKWDAIEYTVSFTGDGVSEPDKEQVTAEKENGVVTLPTPVRAGYTFAGWVIGTDNSIVYNNNVQLLSIIGKADGNNKITFTAKWSEAVYTIDYVLSGGEFGENATVRRSFKHSEPVTVPNPARAHYSFIGWRLSDGTTINPESELATECKFSGKSSNLTLTAIWKRDTVAFTVSIDSWDFLGSKDPVMDGNVTFEDCIILYGTPKAQARKLRSVPQGFSFSDYDWSREKPVNVGDYIVLVYYKFDGEDTPMPNDVTDRNGWDMESFTISQIKNGTAVDDVTVTYGAEWEIAVYDVKEDAEISLLYSADGEEWTENKPVNVGEYFVKAVSAQTRNYLETASQAKKIVIRPATLTITATAAGTYGDNFNGNATYAYSGFVKGEDESVLRGSPTVSIASANTLAAGEHVLNVDTTGLSATNYTFEAKGTYVVSKRTVEVTIGDVEAFFGTPVDLTGVELTAEGLVNGDVLEEAISFTDFNTTAEQLSPVNGIYPITCKYTSANYEVTFKVGSGYYRINPLSIDLDIVANGGTYAESNPRVEIEGILGTDFDDETKALLLEDLKGKTSFVYAGTTYNGDVYQNPNVIPSDAGVYYATVLCKDDNYNLTTSSVQFTIGKQVLKAINITSKQYTGESIAPAIERSDIYNYTPSAYVNVGKYPITLRIKDEYVNNYQWTEGVSTTVIFEITIADNGLEKGKVFVQGWTYNRYDAAVNSPVSAEAKFGEIVYTYSDSRNGTFVAAVPSAGKVGTYWVRAEVAGTSNYKGFITEPVSFEISQAEMKIPELSLFTKGENKNDVYTGKDLYAPVDGYNSTLMRIAYDGTLVADNGKVTVVARLAGTHVVKFTLIDTENYRWADETKLDDEGNAIRTWTIAKQKIALPKEQLEPVTISGIVHNYFPEGFNSDIMKIEGNTQAFAGSYTATVTLLDPENYEWADGRVGAIELNWQIVGINKVFVAIVTSVGGLTLLAASFALVQYLLHKRNKRQVAKDVAARSAAAEAAGTMTAVEAEENHGERPAQAEGNKKNGNKKAKGEKK